MNPDPTSLDLLHDVITPPPVPWWPPAPGWYWVLGALSLLLCFALGYAVVHRQRNRYRREALAEWRRQAQRLQDENQRAAALVALAELLKRAALSTFPREQVAALTGPKWLAFLERTSGMENFSASIGARLEDAAYHPQHASSWDIHHAQEAADLVHGWLKHHRRGGPAEC